MYIYVYIHIYIYIYIYICLVCVNVRVCGKFAFVMQSISLLIFIENLFSCFRCPKCSLV